MPGFTIMDIHWDHSIAQSAKLVETVTTRTYGGYINFDGFTNQFLTLEKYIIIEINIVYL